MGTEIAPAHVVRKYNELMQESQKLVQKVAELEIDRNEHKLVEETLTPLDPSRRAYRLVGEVLVERTVEEVLPSVASNRENVCTNCTECSPHNDTRMAHVSIILFLSRFANSCS